MPSVTDSKQASNNWISVILVLYVSHTFFPNERCMFVSKESLQVNDIDNLYIQ